MKTIAENRIANIRLNASRFKVEKSNYDTDIRIMDQSTSSETGQTTLYLYSSLFIDNNYKITLRGDRAGIIISEHIQINRPSYLHHYELQDFEQQSYERLHNIGILLPGDNFFIVRHFTVPGKCLLKVVLGTRSDN